jgi:hypothetical protein
VAQASIVKPGFQGSLARAGWQAWRRWLGCATSRREPNFPYRNNEVVHGPQCRQGRQPRATAAALSTALGAAM